MKVLFLCHYLNNSIAALRSLGRRGWTLDAALPLKPKHFRRAARLASKFVKGQFRLPHPIEEPAAFREELLRIVRAGRYDAVLPFDHRVTAWVSKLRDELSPHTGLAVADYPLFLLVHDKERLQERLGAEGFSVPRLYPHRALDDLRQRDLRYPVVVKARRGCGVMLGVRYAANAGELADAYRTIAGLDSPLPEIEDNSRPLVQEYIPGELHDGLFLCDRGRVVAAMTQTRKVTYPASGGIGVENVTTRDAELLEYGRAILERLGWHGPCQVEVKRDERDGTLKLMEINPKLWGTLDLAARAGIDFARKTCELAARGITEPAFDYRVGLRYKFLFPLTFQVIYQDRARRWRHLLKLAAVLRPGVCCELDLRDPKPDLQRILRTVHLLLFKRRHIGPPGRQFTAAECAPCGADDSDRRAA